MSGKQLSAFQSKIRNPKSKIGRVPWFSQFLQGKSSLLSPFKPPVFKELGVCARGRNACCVHSVIRCINSQENLSNEVRFLPTGAINILFKSFVDIAAPIDLAVLIPKLPQIAIQPMTEVQFGRLHSAVEIRTISCSVTS